MSSSLLEDFSPPPSPSNPQPPTSPPTIDINSPYRCASLFTPLQITSIIAFLTQQKPFFPCVYDNGLAFLASLNTLSLHPEVQQYITLQHTDVIKQHPPPEQYAEMIDIIESGWAWEDGNEIGIEGETEKEKRIRERSQEFVFRAPTGKKVTLMHHFIIQKDMCGGNRHGGSGGCEWSFYDKGVKRMFGDRYVRELHRRGFIEFFDME